MRHWRVSGTAHTCPECLRPYRFLITDHRGAFYGCRTSHTEAMDFARRKAKSWAEFLDRIPLAA